MSSHKPFANLNGYVKPISQSQRPALQGLVENLALAKLHHDKEQVELHITAKMVDLGDSRTVDRALTLSLAQESLTHRGVRRDLFENFDRDLTAGHTVPSCIDHRHTAFAHNAGELKPVLNKAPKHIHWPFSRISAASTSRRPSSDSRAHATMPRARV